MTNSTVDLTELAQLTGMLEHWTVSEVADVWKWKLSSDRCYCMHYLRALIDSKLAVSVNNPTVWIKMVPLKVSSFVWCVCMNLIPSVDSLARRGITITSSSCHMFTFPLDETNHILVTCPLVKEVVEWVFSWCNIPCNIYLQLVTCSLCSHLGTMPKEA